MRNRFPAPENVSMANGVHLYKIRCRAFCVLPYERNTTGSAPVLTARTGGTPRSRIVCTTPHYRGPGRRLHVRELARIDDRVSLRIVEAHAVRACAEDKGRRRRGLQPVAAGLLLPCCRGPRSARELPCARAPRCLRVHLLCGMKSGVRRRPAFRLAGPGRRCRARGPGASHS